MQNMLKKALLSLLALLVSLAVFSPKAVRTIPHLFYSDTSFNVVSGSSMSPTLNDKQQIPIKTGCEAFDRGDIVVLTLPEAGYQFTSVKEPMQIVKRIIGLPGETVDISSDHTVRINGEILDEPYLTEAAKNATYVPGMENHFELAEHMYFVAGDNRTNSCDSRYFGSVEFDAIIGVFDPDLPDFQTLIWDTLLLLIGTFVLYDILSKVLFFLFLRESHT